MVATAHAQEDDVPDYVPNNENKPEDEESEYTLDEHGLPVLKPQGFPRLKIYLGPGYNFRTATVLQTNNAIMDSHLDNLTSGPNVSAGFTYHLSSSYGFGLRYAGAWYSNTIDNVAFYDEYNKYMGTGKLSDNIRVDFYALVFSSRHIFQEIPASIYLAASMGMANYHDDAVYLTSMEIKGSTFGSSLDLGMNYLLDRNWGIGFELSYFSAVISTMYVDGQQVLLSNDIAEGLHRIQMMAFVSYNLFR